MTIKINNRIKVGAIFKENSGGITPRWFIRDGRQYAIESINYVWDEKIGKSTVRHFSVTSEMTCYEIVYDTIRMAWHIASVDDEE